MRNILSTIWSAIVSILPSISFSVIKSPTTADEVIGSLQATSDKLSVVCAVQAERASVADFTIFDAEEEVEAEVAAARAKYEQTVSAAEAEYDAAMAEGEKAARIKHNIDALLS